jgi:hypothetical protein
MVLPILICLDRSARVGNDPRIPWVLAKTRRTILVACWQCLTHVLQERMVPRIEGVWCHPLQIFECHWFEYSSNLLSAVWNFKKVVANWQKLEDLKSLLEERFPDFFRNSDYILTSFRQCLNLLSEFLIDSTTIDSKLVSITSPAVLFTVFRDLVKSCLKVCPTMPNPIPKKRHWRCPGLCFVVELWRT